MTATTTKTTRELSGRWVVIGMFVFGITATSILWVYWQMHTAPFKPLREAILEEYPKSAPRVDGGQRKIHKQTPSILRVVMKVDFNPNDEKNSSQNLSISNDVLRMAKEHTQFDRYEEFQLHLFWPETGNVIHQRTFERELKPID